MPERDAGLQDRSIIDVSGGFGTERQYSPQYTIVSRPLSWQMRSWQASARPVPALVWMGTLAGRWS